MGRGREGRGWRVSGVGDREDSGGGWVLRGRWVSEHSYHIIFTVSGSLRAVLKLLWLHTSY